MGFHHLAVARQPTAPYPATRCRHHGKYVLHGHGLPHAGCVTMPRLGMARRHIFTCIMHCIMALGPLVVKVLGARCGDLDQMLQAGVYSVLERQRAQIRLGSATSADGEKVYPLMQGWQQVHNTACIDATHAAGGTTLEMRDVLR